MKPGSGRTYVGGRYDEDILVVSVQARPVDGKATQAALTALADAFGLPVRELTLVTGASSRTKIVDIPGDHAGRLQELLNR